MNLSEATNYLETLFAACFSTPPFPAPGSRIAIYGAGNYGRGTLRMLRAGGWEIAGVIDVRAATMPTVEGVPCGALASELVRALAAEQVPVILAVFNFAVDSSAIAEQLAAAGFARVISVPELHETFGERLPCGFWLERKEWFRARQRELLECLAWWADDRSRSLFIELVQFRLSHDPQLLRTPDRDGQYFPADLPPFREPLRFIDGGAYIGDSLPALFSRQVEALAAFEPDTVNFSKLAETVKQLPTPPREIALFPCGLDETTGIRRFTSGQSAASALSDAGDTVIQVAAIDDVLPAFAPTYIKLDIEGSQGNDSPPSAGNRGVCLPSAGPSVGSARAPAGTRPGSPPLPAPPRL